MNGDQNIGTLPIIFTDQQQSTTTTENDFSLNETKATYSKVRTIVLHSQLTQALSNEVRDLKHPTISKTAALNSTNRAIHPPSTLVRRQLAKCPKLSRLYLLRSPLIVQLLSKKFEVYRLYFILPPIFGEICSKLCLFRLRLYPKSTGHRPVFDKDLKSKLKNCLMAQAQRKSTKVQSMEFRIKENEIIKQNENHLSVMSFY